MGHETVMRYESLALTVPAGPFRPSVKRFTLAGCYSPYD